MINPETQEEMTPIEIKRVALGGALNQLINSIKTDEQTVDTILTYVKKNKIDLKQVDFLNNVNDNLRDLSTKDIVDIGNGIVMGIAKRRGISTRSKWYNPVDVYLEMVKDLNDLEKKKLYPEIDIKSLAKPTKKSISLADKKVKTNYLDGEHQANEEVNLIPTEAPIAVNKVETKVPKKIKSLVLFNTPTTKEKAIIIECATIMVEGKSITGQPYTDIVSVANQSNTLREFFESMIFKSYRKHMSKKIVLKVENYLIQAGYTYDELYSIFKIDEFNIPSPSVPPEMEKIEKEMEKILEIIEKEKHVPLVDQVPNDTVELESEQPESIISKTTNYIKRLFGKGN